MDGVLILDLRRAPRRRPARMKGPAKQRARALLTWAQGGVCAHCEEPLPTEWEVGAPDEPTIEHVVARSQGGGNELANLLMKHRACNESGGSRPPSRRDRKWQEIVQERLASGLAPELPIDA